jgi:hypothetical protein
MERKNKEKQQYILSKIKIYQDTKRTESQELITGLPAWESEYDIIHSKRERERIVLVHVHVKYNLTCTSILSYMYVTYVTLRF